MQQVVTLWAGSAQMVGMRGAAHRRSPKLKRQIEEWSTYEAVEAFVGGLPFATLDKSESPDFLITDESGVLGIECVCLSDPPGGTPDRQTNAEQGILNGNLSSALRERGYQCSITLEMKSRASPTKQERGPTREALLALVADQLPLVDDGVRIGPFHPLAHMLPPSVHAITIAPPGARNLLWDSLGFLDDWGDLFQDTLAAKDSLWESYRKRCEACWLAVDLPYYCELQVDEPFERVYATRFQRVFAVSAFRSPEVWEMKVAPV
jgi:hypothetical protein